MGFPATCAHAHADLLSFTLSVNGQQFLIDPGTYGYYFMGNQWRHYFRGTRAHNTVVVDGMDQAQSGGNMLWLQTPQATIHNVCHENNNWTICSSHNGYQRLKDPVQIKRTIKYTPSENVWHVSDEVGATGEHSVQMMLHFHPKVTIEKQANNQFLAIRNNSRLSISLDSAFECFLYNGDEKTRFGWFSPTFGTRIASPSLECRAHISGTSVFNWSISPVSNHIEQNSQITYS
jgi:uncharacterized heparinase superfamily protein